MTEPPYSVFLVEDETMIRMMLVEMLEELGHRAAAEAGLHKRFTWQTVVSSISPF